jgi:hypothetical protein
MIWLCCSSLFLLEGLKMFGLDVIKRMNSASFSKPASEASGTVAHQGHLSDGSGIQKHSCDGLYPMTVRALMNDGEVYLQAFDALSGWAGARYSTGALGWNEAHAKAEQDCEVASGWRR